MRTSKMRVSVDADEIRRLNGEGLKNKEIGRILGCSAGVVAHRLKAMGLETAGKTEVDTGKIVDLHSKGLTNRAIASELEINHKSVAYWLDKLGLATNGRTRKKSAVDGDMAQCTKCDKWFLAESFPKSGPSNRRYFLSYCWSCKRLAQVDRVNGDVRAYLNDRHSRIVLRATKSGIPVSLTRDDLYRLYDDQGGRCLFTGVRFTCRHGGGLDRRTACSVDRIVPEKGYVTGNVVLVSQRANTIKSDMTLDELKEWMPSWYAALSPHLESLVASA